MIRDLGRLETLVGVGRFDPAAPPHTPVVGDLYRINYEKLLKVRPTDIVFQKTRQGVPRRVRALAERLGWEIHQYKLETVEDVLHVLYHQGQGGQSVGHMLGVPRAARSLKRQVRDRLDEIRSITRDLPAPPTLLLISTQPLTAVGPGTFLSQLLEIAGGRNVLDQTLTAYPVIGREKLLMLDPRVIVIVGSTRATAASAEDQADALEYARARVVRLRDPLALLPSTSMPRIAAELARLLHAELALGVEGGAP